MNDQDKENWRQVKSEIIERVTDKQNLVRVVLSGRRRNFQPPADRIDIRPVLIKDELILQSTTTTEANVITKNQSFEDFIKLDLFEVGFANFLIESRSERLEVRIGKRGQIFSKKSRAELLPSYVHDHQKNRFLDENDRFLIAVGISDKSGKVKPSMRDKYIQVEEFLRNLDDCIGAIEPNAQMRLVDLGCGHAYLSFLAFRFFQLRNIPVTLVGVDMNPDSRKRNEGLAAELGISENLQFTASTIADYPVAGVDIAIALHACDTATDDALAWAVSAGARIILAAPCCHHDLHKQIRKRPEPLIQIFEHGILKVRQIDILTDALRAAILDIAGYESDVFEFISGDHTGRNLMIRAILRENRAISTQAQGAKIREYRHTCEIWGVKPALAERLKLGDLRATD